MEFFTADIHFSDTDSMLADNRPFKNIKAYDKWIIKDWNKTAKAGDTIYVIGDLLDCNGPTSTEWKKGLDLIKKIKANVVLIMGNNEDRVVKYNFGGDYQKFVDFCKHKGIKEVHKSLVIKAFNTKVNLVHQIKDGNPKMLNLFGHTHLCSGLYHPYGLCVSTDLNHFRLYTKEILAGYLKRKHDYWEPDDNSNYINPFLKMTNGKIVNIKQKRNKIWKEYIDSNS